MSNHSFRTFNHAYAGTTTWQDFFRMDQVFHGKRPPDEALLPLPEEGARGGEKGVLHPESELLAMARELYNNADLQFRQPGQRNGVMAVLGLRPAEQVVVVLATGSGKTLVFMVGAALEDARTTIVILPTVALRGDMLRRLPGSKTTNRASRLVIVSAEAACTESFLTYARRLADQQQLDRIVVDECHLTVTASKFQESMSNLAWYVRQIRTQTVWLTATLPPEMEGMFMEHNHLVRPQIIRESTNRANIRYTIDQGKRGAGGLTERAYALVSLFQKRHEDVFADGQQKIIVYCLTIELVEEVAGLLGCPSYVADSGTEEEKQAIINGAYGEC
ncbi:P-loop containing nucleoside triphosphate hydrolase protein [Trichoderma barbatum]